MATSRLHRYLSLPIKRSTPAFFWRPLRAIATGLLTPLWFSHYSGHFRSSLSQLAVSKEGKALPWYTYPAIAFLNHRSLADCSVLEFGGGQSTIWWSERAKEVLTFEENSEWCTALRQKQPRKTTLVHEAEPARINRLLSDAGKQYDIIIIDGGERQSLIPIALDHLAPDGALIFDNSEGYGFREATCSLDGWHRVDFYGHCPGVILPHCTSILFRGKCFLFSPAIQIS
jgi:hypothetical protein